MILAHSNFTHYYISSIVFWSHVLQVGLVDQFRCWKMSWTMVIWKSIALHPKSVPCYPTDTKVTKFWRSDRKLHLHELLLTQKSMELWYTYWECCTCNMRFWMQQQLSYINVSIALPNFNLIRDLISLDKWKLLCMFESPPHPRASSIISLSCSLASYTDPEDFKGPVCRI